MSAKAAGTLGPCVCVLLQPRQQVLRGWEVVALEADPPPCWAENNTTLTSPGGVAWMIEICIGR